MVVQPPAGADVVCSHLHRLESEDDIRRDPIERIAGIGEVLADAIWAQVAVAIIMLAAVDIERESRSGRIAQLGPTAEGMNRNDLPCANDREALTKRSEIRCVLSGEEHSGEIEFRRRSDGPVHAIHAGGYRCAGHVGRADVKARGDLDVAIVQKRAVKGEASFESGPDAFECGREFGGNGSALLGCLEYANLRTKVGCIVEAESDARVSPGAAITMDCRRPSAERLQPARENSVLAGTGSVCPDQQEDLSIPNQARRLRLSGASGG